MRGHSCEKLKKLEEQMKVLLTQNESLIEENSDLSQNISYYNSKEAGLQKEIMRKEDDLKSLCNREHEWRNEIIVFKEQMSGQQKQRGDQPTKSQQKELPNYRRNQELVHKYI